MPQFTTIWRHREPEAFSVGREALIAAAQAGSWSLFDAPTQARYVRSWLITCLSAAALYHPSHPLGALDSSLYGGDSERNAAGATIARSIQLLVPARTDVTILGSFETTAGGQPLPLTGETAEPISIATVLVVTAVAAAAAFIAHEVAQVVSSKSFEEEKTKRLVAETSKANETLAQHVEREKIAGKPLPFDETEKNMLQTLQELQKQIAAERHQPLPSPFTGAQEFMTGTFGSLSSVLWPVAVGAVGLALLSK